jgi:hypothetical protein
MLVCLPSRQLSHTRRLAIWQQNLLTTRTFGKKHSVVFGSLWHPFLANSLQAHRLWETPLP